MPRKALPRASPPATEIQCECIYGSTHVVMNAYSVIFCHVDTVCCMGKCTL